MIGFRKVIRNRIEYRCDPLTHEQTRINPDRAKRLKQAESDIRLKEIIRESRATCVFCPEQIEEKTPTFPEAICKGGRIKIGETVIFPNLNPFAENYAVGTLSEGHYLDLDEFKGDRCWVIQSHHVVRLWIRNWITIHSTQSSSQGLTQKESIQAIPAPCREDMIYGSSILCLKGLPIV
jgi:galactose-1-phosphate uridylyltransferase